MSDWSEDAFRRLSDILYAFETRLRATNAARDRALEVEEERLRRLAIGSASLAAIAANIERMAMDEVNRVLAERGLRIDKVGMPVRDRGMTLHDPAPVCFRMRGADERTHAVERLLTFELAPGGMLRSSVKERTHGVGSTTDDASQAEWIDLKAFNTEGPRFVGEALRRFLARPPDAGLAE